MADVASKAINANNYENGNVVVGTNKQGTSYSIEPNVNAVGSSGNLENLYTNRFDDPTYYG